MAEESLIAQLLQARDRERRELARDLHSTCAQQIAALQMHLEMVAASASGISPQAAAALASSMALAADCALEVRRISYALYPPLLDEIGLIAGLRQCLEGRGVAARLPESLPRLRPETAIAVYRIVEEAMPRISLLRMEAMAGFLRIELDLPSATDIMRARVAGLRGRITRRAGGLRITVPLPSKAAKS